MTSMIKTILNFDFLSRRYITDILCVLECTFLNELNQSINLVSLMYIYVYEHTTTIYNHKYDDNNNYH